MNGNYYVKAIPLGRGSCVFGIIGPSGQEVWTDCCTQGPPDDKPLRFDNEDDATAACERMNVFGKHAGVEEEEGKS